MPRRSLSVALCAAVVFASAAAAQAQPPAAFQGRLVDEATGTPVAGASVSIAGLPGVVRTDADGRFQWTPAPPVPFHLIVILPGGQLARPALVETIAEGTTTISLQTLAVEAVTVLGAAPSINTAPAAATTILSGTAIAERSPESLMQALEAVPGITQVSEGHAAVPALRGLARGRTLLLIDGARVTAERRAGPSGTFLDPSVIEGVDVARGPGSVAYGSDALGGVISVRTRRAEPGSPLRGRVTAAIGAGIPEARGAFELSKGLPRGGVLLQAHVRNAEDYDGPTGAVFNSGWEDRGFLVHLTHALGSGFLSTAIQSDFARDVERPRNNSRVVRFYYPFENSHRLTTTYDVPDVGGFRQLTITGFLGWYKQRTDQDRFATSTAGRSIERADVSANDFHLKATGMRPIGRVRLDVGVDVNGRHDLEALDIVELYDSTGKLARSATNVSVDAARRIDTGAYVEAEAALGTSARISAGIRGDRVTTTNAGGFFGKLSTAQSAASGFASITVSPTGLLDITAQLSRGFRDPVLSDRYYRGPSGRGFITGNPDLRPETSVQLDLAARYTLTRTQLAVFFYHYRLADLIERYQTETDFFFFRNRGRARLRGVEVEGRAELGDGYSVELAAQVARGQALDDRTSLDDVSPATLSLLGRKDFGERGNANARITWAAADDRPGPSEVAVPGAVLLDVGAGVRLPRQLELRMHLRNLLNEDYAASPDPRFVAAPGRSLSLTAVLQF